MSNTPIDRMYPDDELNNLWLRFKNTEYRPTRLMSFQIDWNSITKETEKAVLVDHEHWFPKSQIIVEDGRIVAIKKSFYNRMKAQSTRQMGF